MTNRLHTLDKNQLETLHTACMNILGNTGVVFQSPEALSLFKARGFQVDGEKVFFTEEQVMDALKTAPSEFEIRARNPEKSVRIGGDHIVLSPGWGAPFIIDGDGSRRSATWDDAVNFAKLVQTSPHLDMMASSIVPVSSLPEKTGMAHQLAAAFTLTDLPLTNNPCCRENAITALEMGAIVWGSREAAEAAPFCITSVNPTSPLTYGPEAADGLMTLAKGGQALLISSMVMAGLTGPITLAGTAVMEMTESLAGIVLAQLVRPGTPCVCGGTSCSSDLRFCTASIGSPELLKLMGVATQMAEYYGLPCRYGGGLTDAQVPDGQAAMESALSLGLSLASGAHYIHQACGILSAYTAISYEKFVMDEELCGVMKRAMTPIEITEESLALETIHKMGAGGNYLIDPMTARKCRTEFFIPTIATRTPYEKWEADGRKQMIEVAAAQVKERIASYIAPDIAPDIEKDLKRYIDAQKSGA